MKIHTDFQQGSDLWMQARAGVVTASEFDNLVTPKWEVKKGKGPQTYLAQKLAEWWLQSPLEQFDAFAMEQGKIIEEIAKPYYSMEMSEPITNVAFITNDAGTVGCSPDGLLGDEGGIEIKCPFAKTHAAYLMAGTVPDDYLAQVHGSMFVTGRKWWRFMSYCRKFPPLITTVEFDQTAHDAISDALDGFLEKFEAAKAKLLALNGGLRPPKPAAVVHPDDYRDPQNDPNFDGRH